MGTRQGTLYHYTLDTCGQLGQNRWVRSYILIHVLSLSLPPSPSPTQRKWRKLIISPLTRFQGFYCSLSWFHNIARCLAVWCSAAPVGYLVHFQRLGLWLLHLIPCKPLQFREILHYCCSREKLFTEVKQKSGLIAYTIPILVYDMLFSQLWLVAILASTIRNKHCKLHIWI